MSSERLRHSSAEHITRPWRGAGVAARGAGVCPRLEARGRQRAYLFDGDGSAAADAVRPALQAFLLFVWVAPFPRLQNENKVSTGQGLRSTDGRRAASSARRPPAGPRRPRGMSVWARTRTHTPGADCGAARPRGPAILRRVL